MNELSEIEQEKKRKRNAMLTTAAVQVVLLLIFYLIVAWREPNPPNPEFGIELNFGLTASGAGAAPVQSPAPSETDQPEESSAEDSPVEATDESTTENTQSPTEPVKNPNADVVQEEKEASKPKQTSTTTTDKPADKPATTTQQSTYTNTSQGEEGETGDQGNPEGDINKDALYGTPGGGDNGSSLQLAGWEWDSPPKPNDTSQESGKIVYEIVVDEDGYITSIKLISSTVSQAVEARYKEAVADLTFSKTSSYKPAPSSVGKITFIIRAR